MNEEQKRIAALRERRGALPVQLPLWFDNQRGTPNTFLRSALFPAIKSRDRKHLENEVLAGPKDMKIIFTGEQFNQEDLTVWEAVVHLVREQPLGTDYYLSAHGILKNAGMHTGNTQHKQLFESLLRLTKATVHIVHERYGQFAGHLIDSVADNRTSHYRVTVNKELIGLYSGNQWTRINFEMRNLLIGKPLALHLFGYYSTHHEPYPVRIDTLKAYSGSRTKDKYAFKQKVSEALQELVRIGLLAGFHINNEFMVTVERHGIQAR